MLLSAEPRFPRRRESGRKRVLHVILGDRLSPTACANSPAFRKCFEAKFVLTRYIARKLNKMLHVISPVGGIVGERAVFQPIRRNRIGKAAAFDETSQAAPAKVGYLLGRQEFDPHRIEVNVVHDSTERFIIFISKASPLALMSNWPKTRRIGLYHSKLALPR